MRGRRGRGRGRRRGRSASADGDDDDDDGDGSSHHAPPSSSSPSVSDASGPRDHQNKKPTERRLSETRETWDESMAWRLKPVLLHSKLASSMRSLMASTTYTCVLRASRGRERAGSRVIDRSNLGNSFRGHFGQFEVGAGFKAPRPGPCICFPCVGRCRRGGHEHRDGTGPEEFEIPLGNIPTDRALDGATRIPTRIHTFFRTSASDRRASNMIPSSYLWRPRPC